MIVGLTYDLKDDYLKEGFSDEEVAEFDKIDTILGLEKALHENGYDTDRIGNIKNLVPRIARGDRWGMVFNIAEGMYGMGREAQVPALLEAYQIPYTFSDSMVLAVCLHKGYTKKLIRDHHIATPDFFIVNSPGDIDNVKLTYPLFAKPAAEGTGKGINRFSMINTPAELKDQCLQILKKFSQPVLVEEFLPGREFTAGILGTGDDAEVVGVMEVLFNEKAKDLSYSFETKKNYEDLVKYVLAKGEIAEKCVKLSLDAWKVLGCRDAGRVDIRCDSKGEPGFIEVNPLAGLNYIDSDLPILSGLAGMDYATLIGRIMKNALKRYGLGQS